MITNKISFILGAGASNPYKFPLGKGLVEKIYRIAQEEQLEECGFDKINISLFKKTLFLSGINSIDKFLEHRQEFINVGKAAIAQILIPYEKEIELFERFKDETKWYDFLFEKMDSPFEDLDKNNISFITYNYDRSLDHFMFTAFKNKYGKSDEEVAEKLNKIPIIHLHGHLGLLPWQGEGRSYTPEVTEEKIIKSSQTIKIMDDNMTNNLEFKKAHSILSNVNLVYFLGFGYNESNMSRLKLDSFPNIMEVKGTAIGLSGQDINTIYRSARLKNFKLLNVSILEFLKEYVTFN